MIQERTPAHKPDPGWCGDRSRGAGMGRWSDLSEVKPGARMHLCRVRLNSGGYDPGGAYWGGGGPALWVAWDDESGGQTFLRAPDRAAAKAIVRIRVPKARFYR